MLKKLKFSKNGYFSKKITKFLLELFTNTAEK